MITDDGQCKHKLTMIPTDYQNFRGETQHGVTCTKCNGYDLIDYINDLQRELEVSRKWARLWKRVAKMRYEAFIVIKDYVVNSPLSVRRLGDRLHVVWEKYNRGVYKDQPDN